MREHDRARFDLPLVLLVAFTYLYLILFVPPWIPIDTGIGDDKLFLYEATRILKGDIIYRDFFEFYFPGADLFYAALIRLVGPRAWIPNVCLVCLGIGFVWTSTVVCRKLIGRAGMFLPGLLFLWVSFRSYLDAAPHWYSNFLIMVAMAVLAEERSGARLALAGGLSGLAACFSQNHGAVAAVGFAAFILWEGCADENGWRQISRRELNFLIPFGSVVAVFVGYCILAAGLKTFVSSTILFLLTNWRNGEVNRWSEYIVIELTSEALRHHFHLLRSSILALLIPGIYIVAIAGYMREKGSSPSESRRLIILLSAVGLATFASIINAASYWRMATVSLPAFIIVVWMLHRRIGVKAEYLLWTVTVLFMLKDIRFAQKNWKAFIDSPSGHIALSANDSESFYVWWASNTRPGQYVFDAEGWDLYFWFGLENPTKLPALFSGSFNRPEQVNDAVQDLEKHRPRLILWNSELDWTTDPPTSDTVQPVRRYLHANYRRIKVFAEDSGSQESVWERTNSY
jgi:hypothetical protein